MAREHDAMHGLDQPGWARLASSPHVRFAQLARNPILERYLAELLSRSSLIVALYEPPDNACCEHDEHEAQVRCIAAGDGEGVSRAMEAHLLALERRIVPRSPDRAPSLGRMLGLA